MQSDEPGVTPLNVTPPLASPPATSHPSGADPASADPASADPASADPASADPASQETDVRSFRRRPVVLPRLLCVLTILLLVFALKYLVPHFVQQLYYAAARGRQRAEVETAIEGLKEIPLDMLSIAYQLVSKRVGPSVVHINTARSSADDSLPDEFRHLFDAPRRYIPTGQGSGVIVDVDGYIVTNYHVIQGANEISVSLSEGRTVRGKVIGVDALTDLAVLKVEPENLIAAEWGDSDELQVGALVWAVGSPFGLDRSITAGILSAKNRQVWSKPHQQFLQTDAAVNPGNSGGPLVDDRGRVIGINTAIVGPTYQGISFAIPSSIARQVYEELKTGKRVSRGWLGVALDRVEQDPDGSPDDTSSSGALVIKVLDGSPAKDAGIRSGDVIIRWDGHEIDDPVTLIRLVAQTQIGSTVDVVIKRKDEHIKLDLTVGERPVLEN